MYNKEAPKVESVIFLFLAALFSPKISMTPFITQNFFCSVYRVHGTQNDAKIGLEKYALGPEILSKMCQKSGRQTKPANFRTFWPISPPDTPYTPL